MPDAPAQPQRSWPSAPGYTPPPPSQAGPAKSRAWLWWTIGGTVVVVLALLVWGGFAAFRRFQGAGKTEIVQLHDQMRAHDMAAIFAGSDPAFQRDVGRKKSDALFQYVEDNMGEPLSYTVYNVEVNTNPREGTTKELILKTKFTKADGTETLKFRRDDAGAWRLLSYDIRSTALVGKDFNPPQEIDGNIDGQPASPDSKP